MAKIEEIEKDAVRRLCSSQVILSLPQAVKELVENSIDAGATDVSVQVTDWGAEEIAVEDNGSGIREEDFENIVACHATSKLRDFGELAGGLGTFGFRGEALASLCQMSEMSMRTKHRDAERGTALTFAPNQTVQGKEPCAMAGSGTRIVLRRLFSSFPVRRKELERNAKRDFPSLIRVMQEYAAVTLGCRLRLSHKVAGKAAHVVLHAEGRTVFENLHSVFGLDVVKCMQAVDVPLPNGARLRGMVSRTDRGCGRVRPDCRLVYARGRPVDLPALNAKLNAAYRPFNAKEKPMWVLNITGEAGDFDVNVTPDKRTVLVKELSLVTEAAHEALGGLWRRSEAALPPVGSAEALAPLRRVSWDAPPPAPAGASAAPAAGAAEEAAAPAAAPSCAAAPAAPAAAPAESVAGLRPLDEPPPVQATQATAAGGDPTPSVSPQLPTPEASGDLPEALSQPSQPSSSAPGSTPAAVATPSAATTPAAGTKPAAATDRAAKTRAWLALKKRPAAATAATTPPAAAAPPSPRSPAAGAGRKRARGKAGGAAGAKRQRAAPFCVRHLGALGAPAPPPPLALHAEEAACEERMDGGANPTPAVGPHCPAALCAADGGDVDISVSLADVLGGEAASRQGPGGEGEGEGGGAEGQGGEWHSYAARKGRCEAQLSERLSKPDFLRMSVVGQFNKGFIVARLHGARELFLVDQHASDEKYRFEEQRKNLRILPQPLVVPRPLQLPPGDELIVRDNLAAFERVGFRFCFPDDAAPDAADAAAAAVAAGAQPRGLLVTAVPTSYNTTYTDHDVQEMVAILRETPGATVVQPSRTEMMIASRACRSAVMIGTALNSGQMGRILRHMATMDNPWNCPHDRPTVRHLATVGNPPLRGSAYPMRHGGGAPPAPQQLCFTAPALAPPPGERAGGRD